jgi:hypothetical protein
VCARGREGVGGSAGINDPVLFRKISDAIQQQLAIDAQGRVGAEGDGVSAGISKEDGAERQKQKKRRRESESFDSQSISNVVNAFARQGLRDESLLTALAAAAQAMPPRAFSPQAWHAVRDAQMFARCGVSGCAPDWCQPIIFVAVMWEE